MSNQFNNLDKIRQGETHTEKNDVATEKLGNVNIEYSSHFMNRLNHTDANGNPDSGSNRRINKQGMPLPWSSIKTHVRKILTHLSDNSHLLATKTSGMKKYAFIHKPTGHKIVVHSKHDATGRKIHFATYLRHDQPVDDFDKPKINKVTGNMRPGGKVLTLESIMRDMMFAVLDGSTVPIISIEID